MSVFLDAKDRAWRIEIDVHTARQIKRELAMDLIQPPDTLLQSLREDVGLLVDLLECLCRDQRHSRKLHLEAAKTLDVDPAGWTPDECEAHSLREFARSLKGEALERATAAFLEDYLLFCPSHRRPTMQKALNKILELEAREVAHLLAVIDSPEMEARFLKELEKTTQQLTGGTSSISGAAFSESIPTVPA